MTTLDENNSVKITEISNFISEMTKYMDRYMKVISRDESNIPAALFIDQFFKTILIKLDKSLQIIKRINIEIKKDAKNKVRESVKQSKEEIA